MSAPPEAMAAGAALGRRAALRRLAAYIGRNRAYYGLWLSSVLLYVVGFLAIPRLVGWTYAAFEAGLGADAIAQRAQALALVGVATAVVRFWSRTLVFNAAREIEYEIRNDVFAHLERMPQSFFDEWRTGDIMSRCVNDLNSVRLLLGVGLLNVVQTPLLYLGALAMMFTINAKLALLVLLPYPAFILIARVLGRSIHHWSLLVQEGLGDLSNRLQESISGIAVVKAYAMEGVTARRFQRSNEELYRRQLRLVRTNAAMPAVIGLLPLGAMLVVFWIGGQEILAGRMGGDGFFIFSLLVVQLTFPTFIMGWVVALVQRGAASMQRLDELLSVQPAIADHPEPETPDPFRGELELRGLTVSYPGSGGARALDDVSLCLPAGTTLGVVGPVGSGKTTLASVVPRLLEVPDGSVFVDGVDVNRIPLHSLRSQIAMVPRSARETR